MSPLPAPEPVAVLPWWVVPLLSLLSLSISFLAFGWNLYRDLTSRPKVRVTLRVRRIVCATDGKWYAVDPKFPVGQNFLPGLFIVMTLANLRTRPVRWIGWGGDYKKPVDGKSSFVIIPDNLPATLNDGEDLSQKTQLDEHCLNIKSMWAWDSTSRNWKPSWWATRKFRKEVETALKDEG